MRISPHTLRLHKLIESNLFKYSQRMSRLAQGHSTSEEYIHELEKIRDSLKSTVKWLNSLIKDSEG